MAAHRNGDLISAYNLGNVKYVFRSLVQLRMNMRNLESSWLFGNFFEHISSCSKTSRPFVGQTGVSHIRKLSHNRFLYPTKYVDVLDIWREVFKILI